MPRRKPTADVTVTTHRPIRGWDGEDALFSPREAEVLNLRANGNSYQDVSDLLGISKSEVGVYVSRINAKLARARATLDAARDYLAFSTPED